MNTDNSRLNEEVIDLQSRSMLDNLLLFNMAESSTFENIKIDRAHRVGRFSAHKIRPIVVTYICSQYKLKTKRAAFDSLKITDLLVNDQFPKEISERRRLLYQVMHQAKNNGKQAVVSYDKLYVDG